MSAESASTEFRRELSARVKDEEDSSKSIDNRATGMITITATATTLLVGFTGSLIAPAPKDVELFYLEIWLAVASAFVLTGLILAIISIFLFLHSSNPKKYWVSISPKIFFNADGSINDSIVKQFKIASVEQLDDNLIENYLKTINNNSELNRKRMKLIFKGQFLFAEDVSLILSAIIINYFATLRLGL